MMTHLYQAWLDLADEFNDANADAQLDDFDPEVVREAEAQARTHDLPWPPSTGDYDRWYGEQRYDEPDEPTEAELAYYAELEADQRRAQSRTLAGAPHEWGAAMGPTHYFCTTCWLHGFETGAHRYDVPPCDPPPRVPDWA